MNDTWIGNHPFYMGIIASVICILGGMFISLMQFQNIDWGSYFLASPLIVLACFTPVLIVEGINKFRR